MFEIKTETEPEFEPESEFESELLVRHPTDFDYGAMVTRIKCNIKNWSV